EPQIGVRADAAVVLARRLAGIRKQRSAEHRGSQPVQIEAGRAGRFEDDRRQIPLDHLAYKAPRAYLIDVEAWERVILAIALDVAVVDVVVAERAEVVACDRIVGIAAREAGGAAEPNR